MIKINELRTGNLLNYKTAEGDVLPTKIDWQDLKWLDEDPKGFNSVHDGVLLTDKLMEEYGFKENFMGDCSWFEETGKYIHGTHSKSVGHGIMSLLCDTEGWHYSFPNASIWRKLEFFHEVQNLYFVTTGEEIEKGSKEIF